jgi:hypothetical protein
VSASRASRRLSDDQKRRAFQAVRSGDLSKVFGHRYGGGKLYELPDDDAGREDLCILLDHYSYANPLAIPRVLKARAPWLTDNEKDELLEAEPRRWTAQALANKLNLTEAERRALKVRTIGSVDLSPAERKLQRKLQDRAHKRKARRAAKMQTRAEYLDAMKNRLKPWEAAGVSRATWYRRHGTGLSEADETRETGSVRNKDTFNAADTPRLRTSLKAERESSDPSMLHV